MCFNLKCKGKDDNHFIHSCPRVDAKERKAIMQKMHTKWAAEKQANKVVPGQMHTQVNKQDIDQEVYRQDDFKDRLACIQAEDNNERVKQQQ